MDEIDKILRKQEEWVAKNGEILDEYEMHPTIEEELEDSK
jgi:hypothetical protein